MIIDASALLALLQGEPGSDIAEEALEEGSISAANLSEVTAKLVQAAVPERDVLSILRSFDLDIIPVDEDVAYLAGTLIAETKDYGLSLGDRICLATAVLRGEPAVTADKAWAKVKHEGLEVILLR
jgi:PIN domain nuclease of toxin-antitoxin system